MKLLLIMPNFFEYPAEIKMELENMGYQVDFFDDRPSTNGFIKAIIRINKNLIHSYINFYFRKILNKVQTQRYNVIFLISGQSLSLDESMISRIKELQPQAKFILYQWDSQKNFPYIIKMHKYFDRCYSFDQDDVNQYEELNFLPLFYCRKYEEIARERRAEFQYDFCFVGTAHPKKYYFIQQMSRQLKKTYSRQFIYFFFPSRIVFFYRKWKNPEFKKARYSEFHFKPIKGRDMDELIQNSKCLLDSAQAGQSGLTIRAIEALGAKKKLITTNQNIVHYDFYREENIYIYEGNVDLKNIFFHSDYCDVPNNIYKKYSLSHWLNELINS